MILEEIIDSIALNIFESRMLAYHKPLNQHIMSNMLFSGREDFNLDSASYLTKVYGELPIHFVSTHDPYFIIENEKKVYKPFDFIFDVGDFTKIGLVVFIRNFFESDIRDCYIDFIDLYDIIIKCNNMHKLPTYSVAYKILKIAPTIMATTTLTRISPQIILREIGEVIDLSKQPVRELFENILRMTDVNIFKDTDLLYRFITSEPDIKIIRVKK